MMDAYREPPWEWGGGWAVARRDDGRVIAVGGSLDHACRRAWWALYDSIAEAEKRTGGGMTCHEMADCASERLRDDCLHGRVSAEVMAEHGYAGFRPGRRAEDISREELDPVRGERGRETTYGKLVVIDGGKQRA